MRAKRFLGCLLMLCQFAHASAGTRPVTGDAWVYRATFHALDSPAEKITTDILSTKAAYLNTAGKLVFTGDMSFGMYSDTCLFDILASEELAGEVSCKEALPVGKAWHAALKDPTKGTEQSLAVIGVEEVQIDSRSYRATVIRAERALTPWDYSGRNPRITHRRATYWYVPEVKGMAKIEHELIDDTGKKLTHESITLLKFYPALESATN